MRSGGGGGRAGVAGIAIIVVVAVAARASVVTAAPRVTRVITATADVHDAAVLGDRVLLATSGGLVVTRDDAIERVLDSDDGLPGARMRSVSVTDDGVWVGGVDGAALLVAGDDGTLTVARTLALRRVTRAATWNGTTWLATFGGGLYRLGDGDRAEPQRVDIGTWRTRLTDLAVHADRIWVASVGDGIAVIDANGKVESVLDRDDGLPDDAVWDLDVDARVGRVLIATSGGLAVWTGAEIDRRSPLAAAARGLPIRDLRAVIGDGDGAVVASFGSGVWRLAAATRRRLGGEAAPRARALVRAGTKLVVAHDRGAARGGADRKLHSMIAGGLHSPDVTALASAFGATWVGTFGDGLARIDASGRVSAVDRAIERWGLDPRINDLAVTIEPGGGERLWIATDHGLWWHDGKKFAPELSDGAPAAAHVTSLHVDLGGALWATSARVVARRAGGTWMAWTGDERTPMLQAHAVTTDDRGRVWIGSLTGLLELDPTTGVLTHHDVATGELPVDWVTAIAPWGQGVVAGTYHGGLSWADTSEVVIEREGRGPGQLPAGWVNPHAMRRHGDTLWFGALDRGLIVGRRGVWTRLDLDDGLPSRDVTAILPAAGGRSMWIGTRGGIAVVDIGSTTP